MKEDERTALSELTSIIMKRLITLRRAERYQRKGKTRARISIIGKEPLDQILTCPMGRSTIIAMPATISNTPRPCGDLAAEPEPATQFSSGEPTVKALKEVVRTARSSCAAGSRCAPQKVLHSSSEVSDPEGGLVRGGPLSLDPKGGRSLQH